MFFYNRCSRARNQRPCEAVDSVQTQQFATTTAAQYACKLIDNASECADLVAPRLTMRDAAAGSLNTPFPELPTIMAAPAPFRMHMYAYAPARLDVEEAHCANQQAQAWLDESHTNKAHFRPLFLGNPRSSTSGN